MEIIRGKIPGAKKTVVYGPEGIGKSTFAARFPNPLFIDTEGSTKDMDVARTPSPSSWTMLLEQIEYVKRNPDICKTLVVDTIDWAEQMCVEHICATHQKNGIEDFGYGNGYIYAKEEFGRFLNRLSEIVDIGIHVALTAHAQLRKFEQPDEMGAYDRWELKLGKKTTSQTAPLVKEWADMLLFANYKTHSIAIDDKGKKRKAQGGSRVMYTAHHPCWDAKNRYGLAEEMPFDYSGIAHIIEQKAKQESSFDGVESKSATMEKVMEKSIQEVKTAAIQKEDGARKKDGEGDFEEGKRMGVWESDPKNIPKALRDLMDGNGVSEWDVQNVVSAKGYYPTDTRIENYDPNFIQGVLIGAWEKVFEMIRHMKETEEIPFNE